MTNAREATTPRTWPPRDTARSSIDMVRTRSAPWRTSSASSSGMSPTRGFATSSRKTLKRRTLSPRPMACDRSRQALPLFRTDHMHLRFSEEEARWPVAKTWDDYQSEMAECRALHQRAGDCPDANPRFHAWRQRQIRRGRGELGATGSVITHPILAFELSAGCTVGCWFCGVSAARFQGNFAYSSRERPPVVGNPRPLRRSLRDRGADRLLLLGDRSRPTIRIIRASLRTIMLRPAACRRPPPRPRSEISPSPARSCGCLTSTAVLSTASRF